jgi:hypothetical protein
MSCGPTERVCNRWGAALLRPYDYPTKTLLAR